MNDKVAKDKKEPAKKRERKIPKKPSPSYFENVAVYYLERYAATTSSLRRVLERRVLKAAPHHPDLDRAEAAEWIAATIEKMQRLNYVNDDVYKETKIGSLRRAGASKRMIEAKLAEKGLRVRVDSDDEAELAAAKIFVKRKRLGAYRTRMVDNAGEKDMGSMARAGFSRSVALQALQQTTRDL